MLGPIRLGEVSNCVSPWGIGFNASVPVGVFGSSLNVFGAGVASNLGWIVPGSDE